MPSVKSKQANGFSKETGHFAGSNGDLFKSKLANKKLDLMEEEDEQEEATKELAGQAQMARPQEAEVFHDTTSSAAHTNGRANQDEEPIIIYDTQNNTSIAQTAKDQFAAALLRLQTGLDESSMRLKDLETKVDDIIRQRQQVRSRQESPLASKTGWLSFTTNRGHLETLVYLSWPVIVFFAMRALEKRSLLKKLA